MRASNSHSAPAEKVIAAVSDAVTASAAPAVAGSSDAGPQWSGRRAVTAALSWIVAALDLIRTTCSERC